MVRTYDIGANKSSIRIVTNGDDRRRRRRSISTANVFRRTPHTRHFVSLGLSRRIDAVCVCVFDICSCFKYAATLGHMKYIRTRWLRIHRRQRYSGLNVMGKKSNKKRIHMPARPRR